MDNRIPWKIVASVVGIHFLIIFFALMDAPWKDKPLPRKPQKILVQNITLNPTKPKKIVKAEPVSISKAEPTPQPSPEQKPIQEAAPDPIPEPEPEPEIEEEPAPVAAKEDVKPKDKPKDKPKPIAATPKKKEKEKAKETEKPKAAAAPKKKEAEKPKTTPAVKKKETPKKEVAKPTASKNDAQKEKLLKEIENSLTKMTAKGSSSNSKKIQSDSPKKIDTLSIEAIGEDDGDGVLYGEQSYQDELVLYLKALLKLPEYGTVKISLNLKRSGKVVSVKVTKSESEKNRSYLEKTLPEITFPGFGRNFKGQEEHSFNITLKPNE